MQCEICGSNMKKIYRRMAKREDALFLVCPTCGLRWAPNLDVDESFQSRLNENSRQEALNEIREHEFDQVNSILKKYANYGDRGLEIGCAYGWYLDSVKGQYEMEGIEPEAKIAKKARDRGHKVLTGFFPQDMSKDAGKYDFMIFNNVWEHINHTSELIEGSLQFLKTGETV